MLLQFKKLRPYSSKFDTKVCGAVNSYVMEANKQHGNTLFEVKGINEVQWTIDNILNELYTKNTDARSAKKKYKTEYNDGRITVCEYYHPYTQLCEVSEKVILSTDAEQLPGQTALFTPAAQSPVTVLANQKKKEVLRTIQPQATVKARKKVNNRAGTVQPEVTTSDIPKTHFKWNKHGICTNPYFNRYIEKAGICEIRFAYNEAAKCWAHGYFFEFYKVETETAEVSLNLGSYPTKEDAQIAAYKLAKEFYSYQLELNPKNKSCKQLLCNINNELSELTGTIQPVTTVTNLKRNRKVTKQGRAGYTGNKYAAECYKKIINELPPHRNFISGFLGNCAVLREKLPAKENNIGIEVDRKVINQYWRQSVTKTVVHNLNFIDHIVHELLAMDDEAQGLILSLKDKRNTLLYLDPPYLLSSRASGKSYYENELTDKDHTDLLTWCNRQSCMIAISHYPCELYDTMLSGPKWRKITYQVRTRKEVVTEALYMNYPAPKELHEYTWLGNDSWDRQRVKRKLSRIAAKLMELPAVERNAIISHIKNL